MKPENEALSSNNRAFPSSLFARDDDKGEQFPRHIIGVPFIYFPDRLMMLYERLCDFNDIIEWEESDSSQLLK